MKKIIPALFIAIFFLVGIPLILGIFLGGDGERSEEEIFTDRIDTPKTVKVWISEDEKVQELDFEEYITCVTASEMPSEFEEEALKAQSVAARTYAMAKILKYEDKKPESHPDAPLCDTTHCQAYKSEEKLIEIHEKGWEAEGMKKIKKACKATEGQLLYYEGELVTQPLFFSSSGGQTENSEDVFSGAYPYLVSVSSPYEENASHQNEEKTFSLDQLKTALNGAYPNKTTGQFTKDNIEIISHTSGGRVEEMQVGEATFKGTEIRNALGLSSALFSISFSQDGTEITFTSDGFGHGVGMSQYGADGMAEEGSNYKEILEHYYTGTKVY